MGAEEQENLENQGADKRGGSRDSAALLRGDATLAALLEIVPLGVVIADADGNIVMANARVRELVGGAVVGSVGRPDKGAFSFLHADGSPFSMEELPFTRALRYGETSRDVELVVHRANGEIRTLVEACTPLRDPEGQIIGALAVLQDVSGYVQARRQAEEIAEQAEAHNTYLHAVLDALPVGVFLMDAQGGIVETNAAIERIWGGSRPAKGIRDYVQYRGWRGDTGGLLQPEDWAVSRALLKGETTLGEVIDIERFDGTRGTILNSAVPLRNREGEISGAVEMAQDITESRRAEQALRESREQLSVLYEQNPAIVVLSHLHDGRYLKVNETFVRILGYSREEAVGRTAVEIGLFTQEQREHYARALREEGVVRDMETTGRTKDGRILDLLLSGRIIEVGGQPGIITVATDVTERRRADRILRESEEQLSILYEQNPAIVALTRLEDGCYLKVNEAFVRNLGYSREEAIGHTSIELGLFPPEARAHYAQVLREEGAVRDLELKVHTKDGRLLDLLFSGRVIQIGGQACLITVATDVTERRRAEQHQRFLGEATRILSSSLDYEETLENLARVVVPDLADFCVVDILEDDDRVRRVAAVHADPAKQALMEQISGYPLDPEQPHGIPEMLRAGKSLLIPVVTPELLARYTNGQERQDIIEALRPRSVMVVPLRLREHTLGAIKMGVEEDGRFFDERDLALAEELGRRAAVAVDNARLYDSERRARTEAQEANQAKDQFVAMISHELRNPLAAIQAGVDLLRRAVPLEDKRVERALEVIARNTRLQARVVNDLLDLSRLTRGKIQLQRAPVLLGGVANGAVQAFRTEARESGLSLDVRVGDDLWVYGDHDRLQQVVSNLLSNAIKFTPVGGSVCVRAESVGDEVHLVVEDTGIGIAPEVLPRLFTIFEQGPAGAQGRSGLGIGLSLVRSIVERHGGRVWAESEGLGKGSRFIVALPRVTPPSAPAAEEDTRDVCHQPTRLLLVEDNPDTRTLLAESFSGMGYQVSAADSGEAGLALLEKTPTDVILADIGLPGMDGYEFLRRARKRPGMESVLAFAVTGYGQEEDVRRGREAGFAGHFVKPVDLAVLDRRIRERLHVHRAKSAG